MSSSPSKRALITSLPDKSIAGNDKFPENWLAGFCAGDECCDGTWVKGWSCAWCWLAAKAFAWACAEKTLDVAMGFRRLRVDRKLRSQVHHHSLLVVDVDFTDRKCDGVVLHSVWHCHITDTLCSAVIGWKRHDVNATSSWLGNVMWDGSRAHACWYQECIRTLMYSC